jgi:acyl carrier protein
VTCSSLWRFLTAVRSLIPEGSWFRMTTPHGNHLTAKQPIYERLTSIFRRIFEDKTITLQAETSESDIAGWDSFNNASLIAAIEKEFAIRFRTAELQSLHSVGSFVDTIRAKLEGRS